MNEQKYEPVDPITIPIEQYLYDLNQMILEIDQKMTQLMQILVSMMQEESKQNSKEKMVRTVGIRE